MSWTLKRDTRWSLLFVRTSQPTWVSFPSDYYEDECVVNISACRYKRLPIAEDLANYPGESLWLVLVEHF